MRVFKTRWFARFARQEKIADGGLREAIERAERGLIDADLGGGLIKQRVARPGQGRSGGYRAVIAYRLGRRAVFIYGLAKNDRENFTENELEAARAIGKIWIPAPEEQIALGVQDGQLIEVQYEREG
ncbi:MAG: type II toxin-antitoxin system RelE/ParE family toxin [Terracidiphilus sp.]|jgi:hypothetical protein